MEKKSNKSHSDDHNQLPSDEATRNKIDKHLSDIDDTISEEDIQNINTNIGTASTNDANDKPEVVIKNDTNDNEPEKEAPTPWEILGE